MQPEKQRESIDFISIYRRYEGLDNGYKAMMRRVKTPDELRETPAYYKLFPGDRPSKGWLRVAFLLPWCAHDEHADSFASQLVQEHVSELRIYQVARMSDPSDIEQLRRMAIQLKPKVNWQKFGEMVFFWGEKNKRQFVEDFFVEQSKSTKSKKED